MGLIERAHLVFLWSQMYFKTRFLFAMFLYPKDTVQRCTGFSNFWNSVQPYTTFEHLKRRSAKFWGSRFRQSLVHVRCNVYVAMLLPDATTSAYSAAGCSAVSAVWQALGPTMEHGALLTPVLLLAHSVVELRFWAIFQGHLFSDHFLVE